MRPIYFVRIVQSILNVINQQEFRGVGSRRMESRPYWGWRRAWAGAWARKACDVPPAHALAHARAIVEDSDFAHRSRPATGAAKARFGVVARLRCQLYLTAGGNADTSRPNAVEQRRIFPARCGIAGTMDFARREMGDLPGRDKDCAARRRARQCVVTRAPPPRVIIILRLCAPGLPQRVTDGRHRSAVGMKNHSPCPSPCPRSLTQPESR